MRCPFCVHEETRVLDKRENEDQSVTRRRRECLSCKKRFTTYERVEVDLRIIKKDGRRESYSREKLRSGILKACEKRPVSLDIIEQSIDKIEATLKGLNSSEVESRSIGNLVMKELKKLDKVAYIRFASVYKEFEDPQSFEKEVKILLKK